MLSNVSKLFNIVLRCLKIIEHYFKVLFKILLMISSYSNIIKYYLKVFFNNIRINNSLRKYIGFKGGEAKVKDSWKILVKSIFPTLKVFRIWMSI